jgi:hypothetical protein
MTTSTGWQMVFVNQLGVAKRDHKLRKYKVNVDLLILLMNLIESLFSMIFYNDQYQT